MLDIDNVRTGYGAINVLWDVSLSFAEGKLTTIVGPNGAGKSTLIKLLVGELHPTSGRLETTPDIRIGYFAQHQLENLDSAATPLQHLERIAPKETTLSLRTFLGRFGLAGNSEDRPVDSFSGGEKSRLALALLAWQKPHLLLLDEPTNHLDLDMRDALTLALEEYTGAVVIVSHDRSLIRAVADELWLVADGEAKLFDGDLDDYKDWIESRRPRETVVPEKVVQPVMPKVNKKALQSKRNKLEAELNKAQAELSAINAQLGDPETYTRCSNDFIASLNARREIVQSGVDALEEEWLTLEMALEA